jgi:putative transposase
VCLVKPVTSEAHRWATVNYIHHNPVHHGYVKQWQEWPSSSAAQYVTAVGREFATRMWKQYPVLEMGRGWDETGM